MNSFEQPTTDSTTSGKQSKLQLLLNSLGSKSGEKSYQKDEQLPDRLLTDYAYGNDSIITGDSTASRSVQTEMTLEATY